MPRRPNQRYHDDLCRSRAWRLRSKEAEATGAPASPPRTTAPGQSEAAPPRTPRLVLQRQLQDQRQAGGLPRLEADHGLFVLALQEALALALADPAVQAELRAYPTEKQLRILADVLPLSELSLVEMQEMLDQSLTHVGLAALRLPEGRVAVAIVATGEAMRGG